MQKFSFNLIKRRADRVIVINHLVKEELIHRGFRPDRIYCSPCGVDLDVIEAYPIGSESYEGVFLGRLHQSKGIYDLANIWRQVVDKLPTAKLAIIGGGDERIKKSLDEYLKKMRLENHVQLLGYLENDKIFPILKASKVFLFPSHEEGWGISIAEAMACKLPVVSWNLEVYKDIFEDTIVEARENDYLLFAEKVISLIYDAKKRLEAGERNLRFIRKYTWKEVAKIEKSIIDPAALEVE
jgi:glycosyltransferase involved in cell wall biosynthesis